jgi:hypothetical protein
MTKLIVGCKSDKPDTLVSIDRFAVGALTSIDAVRDSKRPHFDNIPSYLLKSNSTRDLISRNYQDTGPSLALRSTGRAVRSY